MLIFDQLKKNDPQLRLLALGVLAGLGVLLAGLWWVQVVSSQYYQEDLTTQAFRSVRIPAVRGKILDHNGEVLAENRPTYNICLYLDELREAFANEYTRSRPVRTVTNSLHFWQNWLGTKAVKAEYVRLKQAQRDALMADSRYRAASNVVAEIGRHLKQPLTLDRKDFEKAYQDQRALPFQVLSNLDPTNIARFEEQCGESLGVNLEVQSTRCYPHGPLAVHLLGHLQRDDSAKFGEESYFSYWLPDYRGALGIELACDKELRGMAGAKSVQVNNMGYRTLETVWTPAEPGQNVVLTINSKVQQATEHALATSPLGPTVHAAAVVMDVNTGDVIALASSPVLDPNYFVRRGDFPRGYYQRIVELEAEKNRATFEVYMPGSIFKTIVALAALEAGLDQNKELYAPPNPREPGKAHYVLKTGKSVKDTAPPGNYNFTKALKLSSNTYFITQAVRYGPEGIVRITERLHFREKFGLRTAQESKGYTPTLEEVSSGWTERNTANMAIGQSPILVTPLQIAVLAAALANGGTVLYPRLVERIEPLDPLLSGGTTQYFPNNLVRDHLGVSARSLSLLHKAMLADTEDPDGTGKDACVPGLRICAKTGTAQNQDIYGNLVSHTTWFASFAPYEKPQYAVVVMVEKGASGGKTCAPIAHGIYAALKQELIDAPKPSMAQAAVSRP
jgi:penicillin-binding protein 2